MRLLFVHDHKFVSTKNEVFSTGAFPSQLWRRYLEYFDELIVVGRNEIYSEHSQNYIKSSRENVEFNLIDSSGGIKRLFSLVAFRTKSTRHLVSEVDAVAVRLPSVLGLEFAKEAIKQNKSLAIEVVGCAKDSFWYHGSPFAKLVMPYIYYMMKSVIKKASHVIYVTQSFLQRRYPHRIGVSEVSSNVELTEIRHESRRYKTFTIDRRIKIGVIGNFYAKYKGIMVAVAALKEVVTIYPNIVLEVVGMGDIDTAVKEVERLGLQENVIFLGTLKGRREIFDWLDSVDIYLQPSLTEGLPRALIEAMSRGCPAIGSRVGGIPELLDERYLVEPNDSSELGQKLLEMISNEFVLQSASEINLNKSHSFLKSVLDSKRSAFWFGFSKYVKSNLSH